MSRQRGPTTRLGGVLALCALLLVAQEPAKEKPPSGDVAGKLKNLRRASYRALPSTRPSATLDDAVRRIEAATLAKPPVEEQEPLPAETVQEAAPNVPTTQPVSPNRKQAVVAPVKVPATQPTETPLTRALEKIKKLPTAYLSDPLGLADALYKCGRLDAAVTFYDKALEQASEENARAWMLFQMGNCLKTVDPVAAQSNYKRLVAEHPKSLWVAPAIAQERVLAWRIQNKPQSLIQQMKDKPPVRKESSGSR